MLAIVRSRENSAARLPGTPQNEAPVYVNWANAKSRSETIIYQAVPKLALPGIVEFNKLGRLSLKQFESRNFSVAKTKPTLTRILPHEPGQLRLSHMLSYAGPFNLGYGAAPKSAHKRITPPVQPQNDVSR